MVIDLCGMEGQFETDSIRRGVRSFGVWSFNTLKPGDYIIRPVEKVKYTPFVVTSVKDKHFTGSDGNHFFTGVMEEITIDDIPNHPELLQVLRVD